MKKRMTSAVAIAASPLLFMAPVALSQTLVTSIADATNTDPGVWYQNDVRTGGTAAIVDLTGLGGDLEGSAPLPVGAALLTTDLTNEAKAEIGVLDTYGMPANTFASLQLSYSYLKATNAGQNTASAPSLKLTVFNPVCDDIASSGDCYLELIYEPYLNYGPADPALDTWTTESINGDTGVFWSTGGFGSVNGAGGPPYRTLNEWLATLSTDFADAEVVRVAIGVGTFNQGQIGYLDDVRIDHSYDAGYSAAYDFDFAPTPPVEVVDARPVPLPSAWLIPLLLLAGGVAAKRKGR